MHASEVVKQVTQEVSSVSALGSMLAFPSRSSCGILRQHSDDRRNEVQSKSAPAVARECSLCVGSIDPAPVARECSLCVGSIDPAPVARECSLCVGSIDPAPVSHESNLLWIQSKLPLSAPCLDWSRCWRSRPKAHASQSSCVIMQYRSCSGLT